MNATRRFLKVLFEDSQKDTPDDVAISPDGSASVREPKDLVAQLTKILKKLGVEVPAGALTADDDQLTLACTHEEHQKASQILFDPTAIDPLISGGFVVLDGEGADDSFPIKFIALDSCTPAKDLAAVTKAVTVDDALVQSLDAMALQLIESITPDTIKVWKFSDTFDEGARDRLVIDLRRDGFSASRETDTLRTDAPRVSLFRLTGDLNALELVAGEPEKSAD